MAHFAKLDDNNVVLSVHVVNNEDIIVDGQESEQRGIEFLTGIHSHQNWKQTSYNASFRKNYACIGDSYDENRNAFIAPKPYQSWILNDDTCQWEAPVAKPDDITSYAWDEETVSWKPIN
jgi:hypothetical protein